MESEESFKAMCDTNTWHDGSELQAVIDTLRVLFTPNPEKPYESLSGWNWSKNPGWRAKYVSIQIDMRDGGFILKDRDGNRISIEQILEQKK